MEALGSPFISRAPMGRGPCFPVYAGSLYIVRLPEIHFTASGFFLKIFDRLCVFVFVSFWSFFASLHLTKSKNKHNNVQFTNRSNTH